MLQKSMMTGKLAALSAALLVWGCSSQKSLNELNPAYDEVVNQPFKIMKFCFTQKFNTAYSKFTHPGTVPPSIYPTHSGETRESIVLFSPQPLSPGYYWAVDFHGVDSDKTRVSLRAAKISIFGFTGEAAIAIEAIRECGGIYGTGYERSIRSNSPIRDGSYRVDQKTLMACLQRSLAGRIFRPAHLHANETTLWVNSYVWGPTFNVWEARFRTEEPDKTYVEIRSQTDTPEDGSLTGLLLESLDKCGGNPG